MSWNGHGFPGHCSPFPAVQKPPLPLQQTYGSDFPSWVRKDPLHWGETEGAPLSWRSSTVVVSDPKVCTQQVYLFLRPCLLCCRWTNVDHQLIHHTGHWQLSGTACEEHIGRCRLRRCIQADPSEFGSQGEAGVCKPGEMGDGLGRKPSFHKS